LCAAIDFPQFTICLFERMAMKAALKQKIIEVCDRKIEQKGSDVGLSFYAFFTNKNKDPHSLMEVAEWWIKTHQLDHFEKAVKIKKCYRRLND
jgi:Family of unknown function (DUF6500)